MAKGVVREVTKEEEDLIKENFKYNPDTGDLWWTKRTHGRCFDKPAGGLNKQQGYITVSQKFAGVFVMHKAHRIAWFLYHGVWPKDEIDHINNIRNDNRIENLREATRSENQANRKIDGCGTSKYKGVSWRRRDCLWVAKIMVNQKSIWLGLYHNEEEAALAYNKAALEYFGEYAKINIIEPLDTGMTNTYISSSSGELTC
jgi:hypothetical protein